MALRTPIAIAMFVAGSVGYVLQAGWLPFANFLNAQAFARFASYDLSVIPLFILMGNFATQGGISQGAVRVRQRRSWGAFAAAWRWRRCSPRGAFGAICGSSVATAATITAVALPEMRRHGYSGRLATGTLAAGGTLGILIPPSVPLVIYAILAEQNIAKLFAAAMVPGIIAMIGYMIAIAIYVRLVPGPCARGRRRPAADEPGAASLGRAADRGRSSCVVFGGIYGGFFSPTEGAGVGAAATFVAALLKREIDLEEVQALLLRDGARASAMIFLIFIGADLMNSALALTQVPAQLAARGQGLGPVAGDGGRGDHAVLRACSAAVMDELSMHPADDPDLLPDGHGPRLRHAQGVGGDLVRHHGADDGRLRPARAAGRPERLRRQRHGQGRADRRELPRRPAVPGQRHAPHHRCCCCSRRSRSGW